jgi:hypothetical protein
MRRVGGKRGMAEESYDLFMAQARSAPCNGCTHEDFCKLGRTCQMYRKWESKKASVWRKDTKQYSQMPDRALLAE